MNNFNLILRNLKFYRMRYLAVMAGVIISTSVLTGALIVGDSVRFTLEKRASLRLGETHYVLNPRDRFFTDKLAGNLSAKLNQPVIPVMVAEGIAVNSDKNLRLNRVNVVGVTESFTHLWKEGFAPPSEDEAVISENLSSKLALKTGDELLLRIVKTGKVPANSPFSSERETTLALRVKVSGITTANSGGAFSLKNNQSEPFNIFLSASQLTRSLDLAGMANLLLVPDEKGVLTLSHLDSLIAETWTLKDAGINLNPDNNEGSFEITSDRIFFDDKTASAIESSLPGNQSILTYLANSIRVISPTNKSETPYSFVTAGSPELLGRRLNEQEIIINEWLAKDLNVRVGDSLQLHYYRVGPLRSLKEEDFRFCIKEVISMNHPLCDPELMPDFPGLSDAGSCRDWETGTPVDMKKIRDKDEQYWKDYKGTPKAFISMATGLKLWSNKFGQYTAFRFILTGPNTDTLGAKKEILAKLDPASQGLYFEPAYFEGINAAANSTDFGGLFLSLSFFIIVSALLLLGMIFSLHAHARLHEFAIYAAMGFTRKRVIRMLGLEALMVAVVSGILGSLVGVLYNQMILIGLNSFWQDAVRTSSLEMKIQPLTLVYGATAGILASLFVLIFVLIKNTKEPLASILKSKGLVPVKHNLKRTIVYLLMGWLPVVMGFGVILYMLVSRQFESSLLFLLAGGLLLMGGVRLVLIILDRLVNKRKELSSVVPLVLRNLLENRRRVTGTVLLLALGTFTIVLTGANKRTFYGKEQKRISGTGGFLFWAENTVSIPYDLNSPEGKQKLGLADEPAASHIRFLQMVSVEGDDASCLNLNQVAQPTLLGVNCRYLDSVSAFTFVNLDPGLNANHPWLALDIPTRENLIPGYADQTVIQWGLRKKLGDTLVFQDEAGKTLMIKLMGGLDNSIFQGNLLVSENLLRKYYPSAGGSKVMLVDAPNDKREEIGTLLENRFIDYGLVITAASERLALFNSVQNTYLSVFMLLGGLGVIIGTIGFGFFIIRNIMGRQMELATYLALGFRRIDILRMVFLENLIILVSGIALGSISALVAILPSFLSPAFQFPGLFILALLLAVFLSGLFWIILSVNRSVKEEVVKVLRKE